MWRSLSSLCAPLQVPTSVGETRACPCARQAELMVTVHGESSERAIVLSRAVVSGMTRGSAERAIALQSVQAAA